MPPVLGPFSTGDRADRPLEENIPATLITRMILFYRTRLSTWAILSRLLGGNAPILRPSSTCGCRREHHGPERRGATNAHPHTNGEMIRTGMRRCLPFVVLAISIIFSCYIMQTYPDIINEVLHVEGQLMWTERTCPTMMEMLRPLWDRAGGSGAMIYNSGNPARVRTAVTCTLVLTFSAYQVVSRFLTLLLG